MLLEVEGGHPFKHCLMLRLDSHVQELNVLKSGSIYRSGEFQFTLSHISENSPPSLTFEHNVEFTEWVNVDKDHRVRRKVITRQPIIIRIQSERNLLTISYPGFTHTNLTGTGWNGYENVVQNLLNILTNELGWNLKILPIKDALKFFIEGANRRVIQVKADVDTPMARFDVSAKGRSINIEEAMASFLSAHLPGVEEETLRAASKKAFSSAIANSIVLYWLQEGLFTRLRFWDIGTELHFVWNNESATYRVVDEITYTLSDACRALSGLKSEAKNLLEWIVKQEPLNLITPGDMSQRFSLVPGEARSTLLTAMKAGLVEPVYRLASTELLEEIQNEWSPDLSRFRQQFTTSSGVKIDGTNPENLEVAFRRVASVTERA